MKSFPLLLSSLLFAFSTGCSATADRIEIAEALAVADSVTLLSLESGPGGARDSDGACIGACYQGWPVLGEVALSNSEAQSLRADLSDWVAAPEPDAIAMCFFPRHGVRVKANGHTYDFVVCFECGQTHVFKDSSAHPVAYLFYGADQKHWDSILSSSKIPLGNTTDGS